MKGGKSWSQQGASNISKIIALKIGKDFPETIAALVSGRLSERLTERFEETIKPIKNPVKKARKSIYPVHQGKIVFIGLKQTNGREAIKSMFDLRPFSEMVCRLMKYWQDLGLVLSNKIITSPYQNNADLIFFHIPASPLRPWLKPRSRYRR